MTTTLPRLALLAILCGWALLAPAMGQEPAPDDPDILGAMARQLRFEVPTRIVGRLLTLDAYDPAVWIEWTQMELDGRWLPAPPETNLLIYPKDEAMFRFFKSLGRGTEIRMTVETGPDGKRRVLALDEM